MKPINHISCKHIWRAVLSDAIAGHCQARSSLVLFYTYDTHMLKQHTFLMHNNNNDQLFQLELPMSWNIEKKNLLILFAFC
ncbi:Uncharacterized protein APZ42_017752 [Daphnia magna]|uniref:Uncharacterized protein n=1 Tax=Daphnia magna TaxID=35525 RepID=A0A164ZMJ4_9CRUS|nr:Uncharacterized protein APZ42_017752 [Daphnia magna]